MDLKLLSGILLLTLASFALAMPGAKVSAPVDRPQSELKPGEFIWAPEAAPSGPLEWLNERGCGSVRHRMLKWSGGRNQNHGFVIGLPSRKHPRSGRTTC